MKTSKMTLILLAAFSVLVGLSASCSCGGDDDDDDSSGGGGSASTACDRIVDCELTDELDLGSMQECYDYYNGLDSDVQQCILSAANCGEVKDCLGLGDDDDTGSSDDTSTYECADETTIVDDDVDPAPDNPDLYASICPDNNDPEAFEAGTFQWFEGDKLTAAANFKEGELEAIFVKLPDPFHLKTIEMYFTGDCGDINIRFMEDLCGSEPNRDGEDIAPPVRVAIPQDAGWVSIPVPDREFWKYPADKFWVVYEHIQAYPYLGQDANDNVLTGTSRFWTEKWSQDNAPFKFGWTSHNYMVRLTGNYFCKKDSEQFTNVTTDVGMPADLHRQRTVWADINGDGWDDVILNTGGYDENGFTVYLNDEGTFTDFTDDSGLNGYGAMFALFTDMDNDGDLDAYLGVNTPEENPLDWYSTSMLNDGSGHFTEVDDNGLDVWFTVTNPETSEEQTRRPNIANATSADFDGDGFVDIYVGSWEVAYPYSTAFPGLLFKGNGDGTFEDISLASGVGGYTADGGPAPRPAYGSSTADYNNDGLMDIYVANYGGVKNRLWENQGDGTFVDVGDAKHVASLSDAGDTPGISFSADFGDIDNDGDLDIYCANITHPRYWPDTEPSSLGINGGSGDDYVYHDETELRGITCDEGEIEVSFIDYDNDGRLDMFLSDLYTGHYGRLYHQKDDGTFQDVTYWSGIDMHDCTNHSWGDYDRDGDLDLLVTRRSDSFVTALWKNEIGQDNNWVTFRLEGTNTETNRAACGARVKLVSGDLTQIREVQCGRGHANSQPSLPVEFGLGGLTSIDYVEVTWPYGTTETWASPAIKRFTHLMQGASPAVTYYDE